MSTARRELSNNDQCRSVNYHCEFKKKKKLLCFKNAKLVKTFINVLVQSRIILSFHFYYVAPISGCWTDDLKM